MEKKSKVKIPTHEQVKRISDQAKRVMLYKQAVNTIKAGGPEHKFAKEKMLHDLIQYQDMVIKALIRKIKIGDTKAIDIYFDRVYGKAKETVDFNTNVQFSLKNLAIEREKLKQSLQQQADTYTLNEDSTLVLPDPTQNG